MSSEFVHLHTHSHYSLLEALPKVGQVLDQIKEQGGDAVALTDNGAMYGIIEFYQKAKKAGIKPIIGIDVYIAPHGREQKRARVDDKPWRLVLLAENNQGYQNLLKLSSIGFLEGFYYRPRIDKELLREHSEGLIALTGGTWGEVPATIRDYGKDKAREALKEYLDIFGSDHLYLELIDRPEVPEQESTNATLIELGQEMNVPVVATKNSQYLHPEDQQAWKVLQCVRGGRTLEDYERMNQYDYDASLVSPKTMIERFKDIPEAITNTRKIADRCNVEIELGVWHFPPVDIPEGETADSLLREQTYGLASAKYGEVLSNEVKERIDYELDIIKLKEYSGYFLSVADYTKWARDNAVVTTTRGSAAGSIVSYIIGISSIDPLVYKLPFERFLNPDRPSAPDVDADFADNQRDKVLKYVVEKYGQDRVAQICTFGTMLARGSIRDVGRALGHPYGFVDQIAKQVPMGQQGMPMTLERAMKENSELKKMHDDNPQVRQIIETAQQIEGCARHVSVHAAGVVISPTPLTDFTPLQIDTREGKVITQYEMHAVEAAGLVKMDFLGIRNLSILGDSIRIVKKTKGVEVDLDNIPVDDKKTFELLAKGYTMGVFQLAGDGMTKYLVELRPTCVEDIMAMVALYRPGPIEFIPEYIRRAHNPKLVDYPHKDLEDILEKSLGLLIYQDDVMLTAIKLAGYSWLEADLFRKAMGKKIPELMKEQEKKFKDGCVENNIPRALASDLWNRIKPFAMYAFNKSHSASYGMVAYQTAYMKANYPSEYMAALMTAESHDLEKVAAAVHECGRMGIRVLPPDINESLKTFTYIDDQTVRFGLLVIKNLGSEVIESIIEERKTNGPFEDLADFAGRISHRAFNKKSLEAMIKAGALDRFGNRNMLLQNADQILNYNRETIREKEQNQGSLFDLVPSLSEAKLRLKEYPRAPKDEYLAWEKEYLGLYITNHPYADQAKILEGQVVTCSTIPEQKTGKFVHVAGMIAQAKRITTKKGDPMAFLTLQDMTGTTELVVFPRTLTEFDDLIQDGKTILVSAKVSDRDGENSLIANSIIQLTDENVGEVVEMLKKGNWINDEKPAARRTPSADQKQRAASGERQAEISSGLSIKLRGKPSQEMIAELRDLFQSCPGRDRVYFLVESAGNFRRIETDHMVDQTPDLIEALNNIIGRENVQVNM